MNHPAETQDETGQISTGSYIVGFVMSLILTLTAYILVAKRHQSNHTLIILVIILSISQLLVQLVFFLHLGRESKPRWNLIVLSFAALIVGILVLGSLWIMNNLNYHHDNLTPSQTTDYIIHDEGIGH